ncbi:MAG: SAV_6107 family HEPN domain-containing protein [Propionibacteriaceae bacterium]
MTGPATTRPPADVHADLQRARAALLEAELSALPHERFLAAHVVALRTAAVVLACRARPGSRPADRPRNAWRVLADVAPELSEWAAFFAATQAQRDAVTAGFTAGVTARQADDLVRDAAAFLAVVQRRLDGPRPVTAADESAADRRGVNGQAQ